MKRNAARQPYEREGKQQANQVTQIPRQHSVHTMDTRPAECTRNARANSRPPFWLWINRHPCQYMAKKKKKKKARKTIRKPWQKLVSRTNSERTRQNPTQEGSLTGTTTPRSNCRYLTMDNTISSLSNLGLWRAPLARGINRSKKKGEKKWTRALRVECLETGNLDFPTLPFLRSCVSFLFKDDESFVCTLKTKLQTDRSAR